MTFIAGFKIGETPILVGDLALSIGLTRTGVAKKVVKLSDNFVLAWSDNRMTADSVILKLRNHFENKKYTFKNIRNFFTSIGEGEYGTSGILDAKFIGWIVEAGSSICFLWRTDFPSEIFIHDKFISLGTGSPVFSEIASAETIDNLVNEITSEGTNSLRFPGLLAVGILGHLMKREMISHADIDFGRTFGIGYDILYYESSSFEHVTDVTYFSAHYDIDVSDTAFEGKFKAYKLGDPAIKVRSGDTAELQFFYTGYEGQSRGTSVQYVLLPSPGLNDQEKGQFIIDSEKRQEQSSSEKPTRNADFYCLICLFRNVSLMLLFDTVVAAGKAGSMDEARHIISVSDGDCTIRTPTKAISKATEKYRQWLATGGKDIPPKR